VAITVVVRLLATGRKDIPVQRTANKTPVVRLLATGRKDNAKVC
jgi:hypothetical protein